MTQISLTVVNPPAPGNFQPPAQSPSDNQDLRPPFRQEYPVARGHRAPGQSNKPLALNGNNLEVETTGTSHLICFAQADDFDIDLPFTNSSNDSEYYSAPSSLWEDGPLQYQVIVSSYPYLIPLYANIMIRNLPTLWDQGPGAPQIAALSAL